MRKCSQQTGLWKSFFFVSDWCGESRPAHCGWYHPGQGVYIRKQVMGDKLIGSSLPCLLLQFLPPGTCLKFYKKEGWAKQRYSQYAALFHGLHISSCPQVPVQFAFLSRHSLMKDCDLELSDMNQNKLSTQESCFWSWKAI